MNSFCCIELLLWREFWHMKFGLKFLWLHFQAETKWTIFTNKKLEQIILLSSQQCKGKRKEAYDAFDWRLHFLLYMENKALANSTSKTEINLRIIFEAFKAWVKAQVCLLSSQAAAEFEACPRLLGFLQLLGRYREQSRRYPGILFGISCGAGDWAFS